MKAPDEIPRHDRRIFAFTGLPGVGKSAVAAEFAGMAGYPVVNMGEEMKKQYESMPIGDDRKDTPTGTWEMAQTLRDTHGSEGTALASTSRIAAAFAESHIVVVDGVRSVTEVETFERIFECPVHLIAVTADEQTRLERFHDRSDYEEKLSVIGEDREATLAVAEYDMEKRTEREAEEGLRDAIQHANYAIDNNGTLKDAGTQCARLMDDLGPLL